MADQYLGNVVLGLHCDGTNGSTTFTDVTGKTVTPNGNAQISTAQSKFGGASALLDGTGDYLSIPHSSALNLSASGDFTVEGWFYINSLTDAYLFSKGGQSGVRYAHYGIKLAGTRLDVLGGSTQWIGGGTVSTSTWMHIALTRSGSTWKIWLNGTQVSTTEAGSSETDAGGALLIGYEAGQGASAYFNGYVDDFRITKGIARYTENFTPSASAFEDDGPTLTAAGSATVLMFEVGTPSSADLTSAGVATVSGAGGTVLGAQATCTGAATTSLSAAAINPSALSSAGAGSAASVGVGIATSVADVAGAGTVSGGGASTNATTLVSWGSAGFSVEVAYESPVAAVVAGTSEAQFAGAFESPATAHIIGWSRFVGRGNPSPLDYAFPCAEQIDLSVPDAPEAVAERAFRIHGRGRFRPKLPRGKCVEFAVSGGGSTSFVGRSIAEAGMSSAGAGAVSGGFGLLIEASATLTSTGTASWAS